MAISYAALVQLCASLLTLFQGICFLRQLLSYTDFLGKKVVEKPVDKFIIQ